PHVHADAVALRELERAYLEHLRAEAPELQPLLVRDALELTRLRADAGIGRVDAIDVGEDLADVGAHRGRDRHRARVGAAPPERRDVPLLVDALEARDHDDLPRVERRRDPLA